MLMKHWLLVGSESGAAFSCLSLFVMGCVLEALCMTGTRSQPGMFPTMLLPQCNYKPRHKSRLTFALSHVFVQRLQKYCTRHVIARETKITFIKLSQSGREGGVFGNSVLFTIKEGVCENNANQVFYRQLKVCVQILKGTDTHPHDSCTVGLCTLTLTLTSCLLFSKPKQTHFPISSALSSYPDFKILANFLSLLSLYHCYKTKMNLF